jgi:hypothetical protein
VLYDPAVLAEETARESRRLEYNLQVALSEEAS